MVSLRITPTDACQARRNFGQKRACQGGRKCDMLSLSSQGDKGDRNSRGGEALTPRNGLELNGTLWNKSGTNGTN